MKHNYERVYEKNINLAQAAVFYMRSPFDGTAKITDLIIWLGANVAAGSAIFNLKINGSAKFIGDARPKINTGEATVSKAVDFAVSKGDRISVDLESVNTAGISAPVTVLVRFDDGSDITGSTFTITAEDLAANEDAEVGLALGRTFLMSRVTTSKPARVRIYQSAAARSADAARATGVDPVGEHGVILDVVTTAENLTLDLAPQVVASDSKGSRDGIFPALIQNLDAGAGDVVAAFTIIKLEK